MARAPIDSIYGLFEVGGDRYGEDLSQLQHALETAELARLDGGSETMIAAALLHDVSQLVDGVAPAVEPARAPLES